MGVMEAIQRINEGGGIEFIKDRTKGDFEALLNRAIVIEDIVITDSKYYKGKKFATFVIEGDNTHYYTTNSDVVAAQLLHLQEGLDEDGLTWNALILTFQPVRSQNGRRYYVVKAKLKPEVKEALENRVAWEEEEKKIAL
ncbi:MAG: hypothetical protein ACPLSY_03730 [Moorellaceae bacterium]